MAAFHLWRSEAYTETSRRRITTCFVFDFGFVFAFALPALAEGSLSTFFCCLSSALLSFLPPARLLACVLLSLLKR
jgi:hypothetical protein